MKKKSKIDCNKCNSPHSCCLTGAWVDLKKSKKIKQLGLRGKFFDIAEDEDFPSGYKIATSKDDDPCTFLKKNLCTIHQVDYALKPHYCKEFPYENNEISSDVKHLCVMATV